MHSCVNGGGGREEGAVPHDTRADIAVVVGESTASRAFTPFNKRPLFPYSRYDV